MWIDGTTILELIVHNFTIQNFICGEWHSSTSKLHETLPILNPATGKEIGTLPRSGIEDVDGAVQAARSAQKSWGVLSLKERVHWLGKIADGIEKNLEEFATLESLDTGKPISLAKALDIPRAIANFRFFAEYAGEIKEEGFKSVASQNLTHRSALGVVGLITPWNLPLYLLTWKIAPAILMGNAVVAKPSELTSLTAWRLARLLKDLDFPKGVINFVFGLGAECGEVLVSHPDVRAISFTGGTKTGAVVGASAGSRFKKLSLELGGKNPIVVFDDAPAGAASKVTRSAFLNSGQICLCGSRLFLHKGIYDSFLKEMLQELERWVPGNPQEASTILGSLISKDHLAKVEGYVTLARELGGRIIFGGKRPELTGELADGAFYLPTMICDLDPASRPSQEEIFGPVLVVHPFETEEEVIALSNQVEYGLSASICRCIGASPSSLGLRGKSSAERAKSRSRMGDASVGIR
jgi:acyl-CoA reductase-like NAD-dependent aldehyde dehydrogenase